MSDIKDQNWSHAQQKFIDAPHVRAFIDAIETVCRAHNMSIGHEDQHGAFVIHAFTRVNIGWLKDAQIDDSVTTP